jgi:hypothetical protein
VAEAERRRAACGMARARRAEQAGWLAAGVALTG